MNPGIIKQAMEYRHLIDVLMSDHQFADVVLVNGQVINTLTREVYPADVAIKGKYILVAGDSSGLIGDKTLVVDVGASIWPRASSIPTCTLKAAC